MYRVIGVSPYRLYCFSSKPVTGLYLSPYVYGRFFPCCIPGFPRLPYIRDLNIKNAGTLNGNPRRIKSVMNYEISKSSFLNLLKVMSELLYVSSSPYVSISEARLSPSFVRGLR